MAGATIDITFRDRQVRSMLDSLAAMGRDAARLLRPIGVGLVANTKDRFDAGRGPAGYRWAPLHPAYLAVKRGPSILKASLQLQRSITFAVAGDELAVGTNKIYGAIHQFGGTILPKRPDGRLFLRTASGAVWGVAREVTIPARPYLGLSDLDVDTIGDVVEGAFARAAMAASRRSG
jgi:phage virion morphogenesis protein